MRITSYCFPAGNKSLQPLQKWLRQGKNTLVQPHAASMQPTEYEKEAPNARAKTDNSRTQPVDNGALLCLTSHNWCETNQRLPSSTPTPEQLAEISAFFRLLSEPARLQLICQLRSAPSDVQTLMESTGFSQSHISRQLNQLNQAGLVRSERQGQRLMFYADDPLVDDLCSLVSQRLRQALEDKLNTLRG